MEFKKPIHPVKNIEHEILNMRTIYIRHQNKTLKVNVKVCEHSFKATVDTGATINVIDKNMYAKMKGTELKITTIRVFAYNATKPIKFLGKFEALTDTIPYSRSTKCVRRIETIRHNRMCSREDQPITWISPIVVVPRKNSGMRICV